MAGERILIVEDDAIIAETLRCMLVDGGYGEPVVVASGEAGIDAADSNRLSLVLMDIRLAGKLDGIAAAERIRTFSDLPIVYLTAYEEDSLLERAKLSAPYGYLVKPVSGRELKATIEMALYRHAIDRKLAESEKALRESEEQSRALLELGGRGGEALVMLQDDNRGEGMCVYANEPLCAITGYAQDDLLGLSFFDLVHPRDRAAALDGHRRRMNGTVMPGFTEVTLVSRSGLETPVEGTFAYSFYRGQPVDVGYIRDIAARRIVEAHVIAMEQLGAAGAVAAETARATDGELVAIAQSAEALAGRSDIAPKAKEIAGTILEAAGAVTAVIDTLALFSEDYDRGPVALDVNETVEAALQLSSESLEQGGIRLRKVLAVSLPAVVADSFHLRQALVNMIANAEYFMTEANQGGVLTVTTERRGDLVRVSIADNGPGIAAGTLDGLLGPSLLSVSPIHGVGFGMDVCRRIVEESGGAVSVLNEPGKGTTYVVELPGVRNTAE